MTTHFVPLEGELWLPVVGFEENFLVSSLGRVRSLDRLSTDGRRYSGKLLKQSLLKRPSEGRHGNSEYRVVQLRKDGVGSSHRVHVLVLEAFCGPRPDGMLGLHRDDDTENNTLDNLYWGTHRDNTLDGIRNGKQIYERNKKSHCKNGHEYTDENTTWSAKGYRVCKACKSKHGAENYARRTGKL